MRYFIPDIRLAADAGEGISSEKFGGRPRGLPPHQWPTCTDCGKSQSFLAQFVHNPERLDLGREGRVIFLFHCAHDPGMCRNWEGDSGANSCLIVEPEALNDGHTDFPADAPPVQNEVLVAGWLQRDDGIPLDLASAFFDESTLDALDEENRWKPTTGARLGGVPFWIHGPRFAPLATDGWRFVGQLDSSHSFYVPPATTEGWVSEDEERFEGRSHIGNGPNFGEGGIAYVFLKQTFGVPDAQFVTQC